MSKVSNLWRQRQCVFQALRHTIKTENLQKGCSIIPKDCTTGNFEKATYFQEANYK